MKYHAALTSDPGLNVLPENPCRLLDFSLLKLAAGERYSAESGDREILAVLMSGRASFEINGHCFDNVGGRPNPFSGKPHSVFIPARVQFSILGESPVEIALPSAPGIETGIAPYLITPAQVANGFWGAANFKRGFHQILTMAAQPDLPAQRLIIGETFTPSGNWSTFPPHKHEIDDLPHEAYHEEMYFFKVSPADGFGLCYYYNDSGEEETFPVRDNTILMAPYGYHTVVSAPGYTTYYLWFLAGNQRVQSVMEDPALSWVGRTVPMLRDLGH